MGEFHWPLNVFKVLWHSLVSYFSLSLSPFLLFFLEISPFLSLLPTSHGFFFYFQTLAGILVGFSTGKCQLMTNRGKVIISQQWVPEPVQSIQLPNGKKTIDEIYVMYQSSVCILQTKQLMQSIRNFEKLGKISRNSSILTALSERGLFTDMTDKGLL